MSNAVRGLFAAAAIIASVPAPARAQWFYPPGYGAFGWGGWGVGTVQGDIAHGLGAMAAGAGVYNLQTAVADSINADTLMRFNQYMFLSQMEANRRHRELQARRQNAVVETAAAARDRLRNRPTPADIARGDALNVVYDELSDPRVYLKVLKAAKAPVKGSLIREIPFQYARAAITASVDDLTKRGAPQPLREPPFDQDRAELRAIADELRRQNEETGEYDKATLEKAQKKVLEVLQKVDATFPRNSREWNTSRRFLKAVYGLLRMLQTPAIDVLLAGIDKRPEATLGELLAFMESFNLRFGAAQTPEQRAAYTTLFPMLTRLRDEAIGDASLPPPTAQADPEQAQAFFEKMDIQDMTKKPSLKPAGESR